MELIRKEHKHPTSDIPILGTLLEPGDSLKLGDMYASPSGRWTPCTPEKVGATLNKTKAVWVREYCTSRNIHIE